MRVKPCDGTSIRRSYKITGIVQGVGFRPFVYRLAHELTLTGWVRNSPAGVEIEIQGLVHNLESFDRALSCSSPPLAIINSLSVEDIPALEETDFIILPSAGGESDVQIAPDSALCDDCLGELFNPSDRRYRYPFITCTNCGPRYSIITGVPYDRPKTTMTAFPLCPDCLREYGNPLDRRFHAQPVACHTCGPHVRLLGSAGEPISEKDSAIIKTIELLKDGFIVAVKGIGGYHLAVDAGNHHAVRRLRVRKKRDEKPFAVMVSDLETAERLAAMDEMEKRLLCSPESPIVIVRKHPDCSLSSVVSPKNSWLGVMLPYTPLHHLLVRDNFTALVMTSGNSSDEPVVCDDGDALHRLAGIADYFLVHNRSIHIRSDDSVMRVFQGKPLFYRRARGYAPRAVKLPFTVPPLLAVGADLKNSICLAQGNRAFLSQHIGDLHNETTGDSFRHTIKHLSAILEIRSQRVVCDRHPDYHSSIFAAECGLPVMMVQHHHAHLASCMAENGMEGDVIGVIFDGTGFGDDGTIWGGEFLVGGYDSYRRAAHFRQLPLPGGDAAVREPWRMAMAYLYQTLGDEAFTLDYPVGRLLPQDERTLFAQMLRRGINSPLTSSCGRLFDAVAALLNIRHYVSYDGQGAIELEALAETDELNSPSLRTSNRYEDGVTSAVNIGTSPPLFFHGGSYRYSIIIDEKQPLQLDFSPMFTEIIADLYADRQTSTIAYRFHQTVASVTVDVCLRVASSTGVDRVVLSGGVFQNRLLSKMVYSALSDKGLQVFTHRLVPPNDGGIALGQAVIAGRRKG